MATCVFAIAGSVFEMYMNLQMPLLWLVSLGTVLYLSWDQDKTAYSRRLGALLLLGFVTGVSLAPLVDIVAEIDPQIVVQALLFTCVIFMSFSLCALFSERRSWLFLGGIISSYFSIYLISALVNLFFPNYMHFNLALYGGLFVFSLYVIFDTQMIVEKRLHGSRDVIGHALDLFLDLVAIFVRILIILARNSEQKKKERKSRR
jgi:FtsH-binding integral membrane protein